MRAYRFTMAVVVVLAVAGLVGLLAWFGFSFVRAAQPAVQPIVHPPLQGKQCAECHKDPHPPGSIYRGPCDECHVITSWKNVYYTHSERSMNQGIHPILGCSRCHLTERKIPDKNCETCHQAPHRKPSFDCSACHVPAGWAAVLPAPPGHLSLAGGHSKLTCLQCHNNPNQLPPSHCVDCHGPRHGGLVDCERCHDVKYFWDPVKFKHDRVFALVGQHRFVTCTQCHGVRLLFAETQSYCNFCHAVVHPDLTDCASCHTPYGWVPSTFTHSRVWTLTGAHAELPCTACHPNNNYAHPIGGGSTQCVACHGPHHGGLTQCQECHNTSSWTPVNFNHSDFWALTGTHADISCTSCHPNGQFAIIQANGMPAVSVNDLPSGPPACSLCHGQPHGTCLPACSSCHNTTSFSSASFDHSSIWALTGQHVGLACNNCHPYVNNPHGPNTYEFCVAQANGHSAVPPSANVGGVIQCYYCHESATFHGPLPSGFQCTTCHNTTGWSNLNPGFVHPGSFPLNGQHQNASCIQCHGNPPIFAGTSAACVSCHAGVVPHVGPTDCGQCHNPVAWSVVNFTHVPMTFHPDSLGINQVCTNCHKPGGTPPWGNFTVYSCTPCHTDGRTYPPPGY